MFLIKHYRASRGLSVARLNPCFPVLPIKFL